MILKGTFEFSHINMVVANKTDVYHKMIVGEKNPVVLWHKEHCRKVFKPEDIKVIIQEYLDSKYHRVCPSESTINIYHKTKKEQIAEGLIPNETLFKRDADGKETMVKKLKKGERVVTERDVKPSTLFQYHAIKERNPMIIIDEVANLSPAKQRMLSKMMR